MAPSSTGVYCEASTEFTVDARAVNPHGGEHVRTHVSSPSGTRTDALIRDLGDGTYRVEYTPYEEGELRPGSGSDTV